MELDLWGKVDAAKHKVSVLKTKVEIKLAKATNVRWVKLESDGSEDNVPTMIMKAPDTEVIAKEKAKTEKWDRLAHEVQKEEEDAKLEGDAALNKLFQDIYRNGMKRKK